MGISALDKIQEIQAKAEREIQELRQQAVSEIVRRLADAKSLVQELEAQYTALTGKNLKGEAVTGNKRARLERSSLADASQLSDILAKSPDKRLNRKGINAAGFSLKSALNLAKANPKTFGFEQNGPQGEVWLK